MNGTVNGWTKADVSRLREVMLGQGRGIDEIADEVRSICHVTRLASYRLAHGLSQPQAVARCRKYAQGGVTLDQPTLSRLEQFPARGSRTPLAVHLLALATAYGTQPLRLLTPDALERLDPREREVILRLAGTTPAGCDLSTVNDLSVGTGPGCGPPGAGPGQAGPVNGPGVPPTIDLTADPARAVEDAGAAGLVGAARRAFTFSASVEGSNIGPETLAEIESEVRRLAYHYPQYAVAPVVAELTQIQQVGFRLLAGRQRPPQARTLFWLMGIVSGMLARASHDLGDPGSAMTQARAAYICADNADHDALRTWVRGMQSLICYWAGWPRDALRYAQLGGETVRGGLGSSLVWIAAQEARAWGMVGNEEATVAALKRARRVRERVRGDDLDEIGGLLTFAPARQLYYAAESLALIPEQTVIAEEYARRAISAYEEGPEANRSFGDEAGARCALAVSRVRAGDAEGARDALGAVLAMPVGLRINGVIASAHRVKLAAAGIAGGPAGRQLREEITNFCLMPAREERR
jgi:transcriptional regulator with XRE-family HTH domain